MTEAAVSVAGNLTDDPELHYTEGGIARARFRVAVSGRREREASFFTVVCGATRPSTPPNRWPRAAGWWSWAGSSSGAGRPRMPTPARSWRSWPRNRAKPTVGDGHHNQGDEELQPVALVPRSRRVLVA
jgi:Single-strand binding protein family